MKLYEKLADEIEGQIARGELEPGERVISVRRASERYRMSITTVVRAVPRVKESWADRKPGRNPATS